jgi:hypothetical protein
MDRTEKKERRWNIGMDGYGDRKGTDQERKGNRGFKEKRIMKGGKGREERKLSHHKILHPPLIWAFCDHTETSFFNA